MNNAIFGKTMENIRRRVDIRLCTNSKKAEKLIAKPNFKSRTIFSENLAAIHMNKTCITFDKPMIIGMSILDISKVLMYDFHYKFMKTKYDEKLQLLYTDTDSLIYNIYTEDIYTDMKQNIDFFDTSDYPANNEYGIPLANKKVLGKFKDECNGEIMEIFLALKSKNYVYKMHDSTVVKKLKGVPKNTIEKKITFEDFYNCLFHNDKIFKTSNLIHSKKHEIFSIKQNKLALSPLDEKRYTISNTKSLPYGHYLTL